MQFPVSKQSTVLEMNCEVAEDAIKLECAPVILPTMFQIHDS